MLIMLVCGALLLLGLAAGVSAAGRPFSHPTPTLCSLPEKSPRRFVWYASLTLTAGVLAGITIIGAGGRLAMRLLAVTAGDDAQGRITEAREVVGDITLDGTIGFVLFNGIFGGVFAAEPSSSWFAGSCPPDPSAVSPSASACSWSSGPRSTRSAGRTPISTSSALAGSPCSCSPPWLLASA